MSNTKGITGHEKQNGKTQTMKIEVKKPGVAMLLTVHGGGITVVDLIGEADHVPSYQYIGEAVHSADDDDWLVFMGTQFNPDLNQIFYRHAVKRSEIKQIVELTDDMWEKTITQMVPVGPGGIEVTSSEG